MAAPPRAPGGEAMGAPRRGGSAHGARWERDFEEMLAAGFYGALTGIALGFWWVALQLP